MTLAKYNSNTSNNCFRLGLINILPYTLTILLFFQETYGEDPFLNGLYSQFYVKGLHGTHPRYVRTSSGCKHFDVHNGPENIPVSRFSFNAVVCMIPYMQRKIETVVIFDQISVHTGSDNFYT